MSSAYSLGFLGWNQEDTATVLAELAGLDLDTLEDTLGALQSEEDAHALAASLAEKTLPLGIRPVVIFHPLDRYETAVVLAIGPVLWESSAHSVDDLSVARLTSPKALQALADQQAAVTAALPECPPPSIVGYTFASDTHEICGPAAPAAPSSAEVRVWGTAEQIAPRVTVPPLEGPLAALLGAAEPDQVRQGLALLQAMEEHEVLARLSEGMRLVQGGPTINSHLRALVRPQFARAVALQVAAQAGLLEGTEELHLSNAVDLAPLRGHPTLRSLVVEVYDDVEGLSDEPVTAHLADLPCLSTLRLEGVSVEPGALWDRPMLREITLEEVALSLEDARLIGQATHLTALRMLNISEEEEEEDAFLRLFFAESLPKLRGLERLSLSRIPEGCVLPALPVLAHLELFEGSLSDLPAHLTTLKLDSPSDIEDPEDILGALRRFPGLQSGSVLGYPFERVDGELAVNLNIWEE